MYRYRETKLSRDAVLLLYHFKLIFVDLLASCCTHCVCFVLMIYFYMFKSFYFHANTLFKWFGCLIVTKFDLDYITALNQSNIVPRFTSTRIFTPWATPHIDQLWKISRRQCQCLTSVNDGGLGLTTQWPSNSRPLDLQCRLS